MNRLFRPLLTTLAATTPLHAATKAFETFEGENYKTWETTGSAFGKGPVMGKTPEMNGEFKNYSGERLATSGHGGDAPTGTLVSPEFEVVEPYITFLVGGGGYAGKTAVQLLVDGKVVREVTGKNDLEMRTAVWDVHEFLKKKARIRLIDEENGTWGIIGADHFLFTNYPNQKFPASTRGGKAYAEGLVNDPNLPGVTIPKDTTLKSLADTKGQTLISPTALAFDEKNNVYLSETHRFRFGVEDDRDNLFWYLDDLQSQEPGARRAMHEKWKSKVSIEKLTEKSEIVRKLAEPDGDGVYRKSTVFADKFNDVLDGTGAGVFSFEGTTYFACIPKLWMLTDKNGDGVADERKVIEEGFGIRVSISGHDMNGFALGPDGRIYGTIGDRGLSFTTKEGKKYHYPNQGSAFRFEPDGTGFEIFHTGLRNPKEIAFDAYGNAFTVDNNADQGDAARIVYLVEGGDSGWQMEHQTMMTFHRQIGLPDRPPSRWMNEKYWELQNDIQPAYILPPQAHLTSGPSGLTYHPGTGFLPEEANHFLICDYRGSGANSGIWSFEMAPKDAGMEMTSNRKLTWGIGATDVEYSWDGRLFVSDFITGWTSSDKGRLLAFDAGEKTLLPAEAKQAAVIAAEGFSQRSSDELAKLLKHPDARIRLRAQIELTRQPDALARFTAATASADPLERIHGVWGLGILARRGPVPSPATDAYAKPAPVAARTAAAEKLVALLKDKDPEFRAQVLRSLADTPLDGNKLPLAALLKDESLRVRFFAAIAIGKLKATDAFDAVTALLAENDNKDVYLRHSGIVAFENIAEPAKLAALSSHKSAAVRLAATVALRRLKSADVAVFVNDTEPKVADEAIRAIYDNTIEDKRPVVAALLDHVHDRPWTEFMLRRVIHNSFRIGDLDNLDRVIRVALDEKLPENVRKEALRLLSIWTEPFPADQLTGHWRPLTPRDPESVRPNLNKALPELLHRDGFVLTAALGLMEHYKLDTAAISEDTLRRLITNTKLPAEARAKGLDLLVERKPADLNKFLLSIATDGTDEVALAALTGLASSEPKSALAPLQTAILSKKANRAQKAWPILARIPGEESTAFIVKSLDGLKAANGIAPDALELIEAAKSRKEPTVAAAVATLEKSFADNADPLVKWNPALEGGDAKAGFALFSSHPAGQCIRCHRAGDGHSPGGDAGPNLVGIAKKHERRYFLESMILPAAQVAPGFGIVSVTLKNGATIGGNLLADTPDHIDINATGKDLRIKKSDVELSTPPVSGMPPMEYILKPAEVRDLVAWLATLDKPAKDEKPAPKPTLLDPATLKK